MLDEERTAGAEAGKTPTETSAYMHHHSLQRLPNCLQGKKKKNIRADDVYGSTIQPSHDEKRAKLGAEKNICPLELPWIS